jgi:hypothetical protein
MSAFLEGDLSIIGSSIIGSSMSLVHRDKVRDVIGSDHWIQSVEINTITGAAVEVRPYLQSGAL